MMATRNRLHPRSRSIWTAWTSASWPFPSRPAITRLQAAEDRLFYLECCPTRVFTKRPAFSLNVYDFKERKAEMFVEKVHGYWVSADGKKLLYRVVGRAEIRDRGVEKKPEPPMRC